MSVDSLLLSASWSQLHITYANLPLEAAESLHPAFFFLPPPPAPTSREFFSSSLPPAPPPPVLGARCAFTLLQALTAVIQPAWLQDNGVMFLLLGLLTVVGGLHSGPSKSSSQSKLLRGLRSHRGL